jgi:hypothetical protein
MVLRFACDRSHAARSRHSIFPFCFLGKRLTDELSVSGFVDHGSSWLPISSRSIAAARLFVGEPGVGHQAAVTATRTSLSARLLPIPSQVNVYRRYSNLPEDAHMRHMSTFEADEHLRAKSVLASVLSMRTS